VEAKTARAKVKALSVMDVVRLAISTATAPRTRTLEEKVRKR